MMKELRLMNRSWVVLVSGMMMVGMSGVVEGGTWVGAAPVSGMSAGDNVKGSDGQVIVDWYDPTGLDLIVRMPGVDLSSEERGGERFVRVQCPKTEAGGEEGQPSLPVLRRMFCVPAGASVEVVVEEGSWRVIDLGSAGLPRSVFPRQALAPALSEGVEGASAEVIEAARRGAEFRMDRSAYAAEGFSPSSRVVVREAGIMGGLHLYHLEARPVAYDGPRGQLAVWPEMVIRLRFRGGSGGFEEVRSSSPGLSVVVNPPHPSFDERTVKNFLIIVAPDLVGSAPLAQFVNWKTSQGYAVTTYAVSVGMTRDTIKSYIQGLWGTSNSPDYLLLIGDALRQAATAASYTIPQWVGGGAHTWGTDLPYACMDGAGDWYVDIPFGRWPVRTVSDLQNIVSKTLYVEGGSYADASYAARALFLAHPDPDAQAAQTHDEIIETYMLPNQVQPTRLYYDNGATEADVINGFNAGCTLAVYIGHSTYDQWHAPLFRNPDISGLTNTGMYPLAISFSCVVGEFWSDVVDPVMMEHFLRVPGKGAAACYSTAMGNLYGWVPWLDMYRSQMAALYGDKIRTLGPALDSAIGRFVTQYGPTAPASRDFAEVFQLLGDPSLSLPMPPLPNYLILTPPDFANTSALNQLIASRQARGFNVITHTVSSGTTNTALKTYVHSLWGTANSPKYVVIIGDTAGSTSTSNTIPHFVGLGYRQGTTDWPYVCMDTGDDWYPEIPIGRLSVQNTSQLQAVVDKTVKVESGLFSDPDYVKRSTFLANSSSDVSALAQSTHNWVVDTYLTPNGYTATKVYGALGGTTAQVSAAVNAGSLFTVYMGHSADTGWWNPQFYQSDINALTNNGLYGVAMGWSCHTAQYELSECSGETWLRAANKGAAAYISASEFIYWGSDANWAPSVACEKAFFESVFEDGNWELGPAWLNGMYRFLREYGGWDGVQGHVPPLNADKCRDFMEEFVILGDPALKLPQPNGISLVVDPVDGAACSPPTTQVGYSVQAGTIGNFHEVVTLSASGVPTGAIVQFSNNQHYTPFLSVMTISNLSAVTPGKYNIVVQALSATRQKATTVTLSVSPATAGIPLLATPASGSTNVSRLPTLTWGSASGALGYHIEIATDPGFGNVQYNNDASGTSHTVDRMLASGTKYYWHVQAVNGCGASAYSPYFTFTTLTQGDYFTQSFSGSTGSSFDLDNHTLVLTPNGSGNYYMRCMDSATTLPTDPVGGTTLSLGEDGSAQITLSRAVLLYGASHTSFYVNANGNITFTGPDSTWQPTLASHFSMERISAMFADFDTTYYGSVSWKSFRDRVTVTWQNVPESGTSNQNTFQIEMFFSGKIQITWLAVAANAGIVGVSAGYGIPTDYLDTDLSATTSCTITGACCNGQTCAVKSALLCASSGGTYHGDNTTCTPNPCIDYNEACVIISEVVDATLSGGCPKYVEITNTATTDFAFIEGGIIIQHGSEADVDLDVNLAGVVIPAGHSIVVNSDDNGTCTGAFQGAYGFAADLNTAVAFGNGGDRFILTDKADGSHLLDIYGEFGVNGVGRDWECTRGYAYRLPAYSAGRMEYFRAAEWYFGGKDSLNGSNAEELLALYTTPKAHTFTGPCSGADHRGDMDCNWYLNGADVQLFITAILNPSQFVGCDLQRADINGDGLINMNDCQPFVQLLLNW